ncbi:unnamed protein product [Allacma fusca]|uniref:FAD-binding PCMH-type domain-containing protein n=1 Tax=Allacma fusca TaxID=39272 RepID=A0A8J2M3V4_9HEXA|nr:unnamed protein product [Allacma fusca]
MCSRTSTTSKSLLIFLVSASQYLCDNQSPGLQPFPLENFPSSVSVNFSSYENWAGEVKTQAWIAYPENAAQILELANWARNASIKLRPSGNRHSWAPLTVAGNSEKALVVDTTRYLNKMGIISSKPGDSSFWAEPGLSVISILAQLETANLSLASFPAVGEISIGGVLAVGAHGLGIASQGKPSGHTFGALSNLVIELTAVVFDPISDSYILKNFHRSDPETKAFLINFGRSFITNITLRAGPLVQLNCESVFQFSTEFAYAPTKAPDSMAWFHDIYSRVEIFYIPYYNLVWVLKFNMSAEKPPEAIHVTKPYNFGNNFFKPDFQNSLNIWGTPKDTLLFFHPDSERFSDGSWTIVTSQGNAQNVIHNSFRLFEEARTIFDNVSEYILEMRFVTVDDPSDVGIKGAESPGLGHFHPIEGRPDMNIVVVIEITSTKIVTTPEGQMLLEFLTAYEKKLFKYFNDGEAIVRLEWAKGWGFSNKGPNTNAEILAGVKKLGKFGPLKYSVDILNKYDPFRVFTSKFTDFILE